MLSLKVSNEVADAAQGVASGHARLLQADKEKALGAEKGAGDKRRYLLWREGTESANFVADAFGHFGQ